MSATKNGSHGQLHIRFNVFFAETDTKKCEKQNQDQRKFFKVDKKFLPVKLSYLFMGEVSLTKKENSYEVRLF